MKAVGPDRPTSPLLTTLKLAFMPFLVASTSALVHAEALRSNVIVLSVLTASARSVEGHLRQDTRPMLDEQPLIDGDDTVLQVDRFPWLSNAMKINNNAVILKEPNIIEDKDDPRYNRLPLWTKITVTLDNSNDTVPPDLEEQEIIKVSSSTFAEEGPIIATDIHSSSMPVDHGHGNKSPNSYLPASADADQGTNDDSSDDTSSLFEFEDQGPPDEPSLKEQPLLQANNN